MKEGTKADRQGRLLLSYRNKGLRLLQLKNVYVSW